MRRPLALAALLLVLPLLAVSDDEKPKKETKGAKERAEALALISGGKAEEARTLLRKVIKANSEDCEARVLLGRVHQELGDLESAEKQFKKAVDGSEEKQPEAAGRLAEIYAATGRHAEAVKLAEETLKDDAAAMNARLALATVQLETGKGDDAEKTLAWFEEYIGKAPTLDGMSYYTLGRGLWMLAVRRGDKDLIHSVVDGGGVFQEALDGEGVSDAEVLATWGHCYMDKYQSVFAKHNFEDALKANPKCASAIYGMARVLAEGGKMPQALGAIEQALQLDAKLFDALLFKAMVQGQQQQYGPAEATLKGALKINPKSVQALALLAANHELQGHKAEREKIEAELKEINPNCGLAWYYIGDALGNKMLFEEANVYLKKAVEADTKLWEAYIEYGMNSLRLGDEVTALKYLNEAYERDPFNIRLVNTMTLMDSFPKEFTVIETKHFRIRMTNKEIGLIQPYVVEVHERAWDTMVKRYHFEPQVPIVCDMYSDQDDFSVRTVGMSGLGALGACFGRVCTLLSPRAKEVMGKFNWGTVVWHELGHVWALQLSKNRVPRWFTEGLSTYEEKLGYPGWERELELEIFNAFHGKKLMKIDQLHGGGDLLNLYLYGSLITEFIATKWGFDKIVEMLKLWGEGKDTHAVFQTALRMDTTDFDKEIHDWIGGWLKSVSLRVPFRASREEVAKLEKAINDNPMDAESLGRLARILDQAGQKADAEMLAKKALKIDDANQDALIVMAAAMGTAEKRRYDKAAEYLQRAIDAGAKDFQVLWQRALMLQKADREDECVAAFETAKKAFPRFIGGTDNPYAKLIDIYTARGDEENRLKQMEQLVAIDHDTFKLRMDLAEIYRKQGKTEPMVKTLESALYIGVFDTRLHAYLGRAYRDLGQHEKALHEFKGCVLLLDDAEKSAPGKWQIKIAEFKAEAAQQAAELRKFDEARALAKEAILADPNNELGRKVLEDLNSR